MRENRVGVSRPGHKGLGGAGSPSMPQSSVRTVTRECSRSCGVAAGVPFVSRGQSGQDGGENRVTDTPSGQVVSRGRTVGNVSVEYLGILPNIHLGMESRGMHT